MAKLSGPLLSIEAQGSVADILTFQKHRTLAVAKKFNRPTIPLSTAQIAQRLHVSKSVDFWKTFLDVDPMLTAWNNLAKTHQHQTGYSLAQREILHSLNVNHHSTFFTNATSVLPAKIRLTPKDVWTKQVPEDETHDFLLKWGLTPNALTNAITKNLYGPYLDHDTGLTEDQFIYLTVTKNGTNRAGLLQLWIVAEQTEFFPPDFIGYGTYGTKHANWSWFMYQWYVTTIPWTDVYLTTQNITLQPGVYRWSWRQQSSTNIRMYFTFNDQTSPAKFGTGTHTWDQTITTPATSQARFSASDSDPTAGILDQCSCIKLS